METVWPSPNRRDHNPGVVVSEMQESFSAAMVDDAGFRRPALASMAVFVIDEFWAQPTSKARVAAAAASLMVLFIACSSSVLKDKSSKGNATAKRVVGQIVKISFRIALVIFYWVININEEQSMDIQTLLHVAEAMGTVLFAALVMTLCMLV